MKNFLSDHAKIRLEERSRLTEDALLRLLNGQLCVTLGVQPCGSRLYKLIYSEPDAAHRVVIHDMVTGGVVTILHLDYEGDRVWRATKKELKRAKRLASTLPGSCIGSPPAGFRYLVVVIWISSELQSMRVEGGFYRFAKQPQDADDALGDSGFVEKLLRKFQEKKIPFEAVEEVLLVDRDQNIALRLPWHVLEDIREDPQINDGSVRSPPIDTTSRTHAAGETSDPD